MASIDDRRLWESVQTLGEIGATDEGGLMRVTGSEADRRARDRVVSWFEDAGLDVSVDPVGNVLAHREGTGDGPPVVTGSHIDTVPQGGTFDGTVGVLGPLEVVRTWNEAGVETDRPVEIVVFTEEEGTRFGVGLLGSVVASGELSVAEALELEDDDGRSLASVLSEIGYDGSADLGLDEAAAFVEMHVEQGPVLDDRGVPVGIVESITGYTHSRVTFRGQANHAGTTPMDQRRDAFMGAAEFACELEAEVLRHAESSDTVGTVGKVEVQPNGLNVVPGEVELGVDVRDTDGEVFETTLSFAKETAESIASERGLELSWEALLEEEPVPMDRTVVESLVDACEATGVAYHRMPSGAGHDAINMAKVVPTGMLFVPSEDGVSHSPDEYTEPEDLARGTQILETALRSLASD